VLAILAHAGLVPDPARSVAAAAAFLAGRRERNLSADGPPARVARRLGRTIPVVYGAEGVGAVAAEWWKARLNVNAKTPAFCGSIPPASYDELSGWGQGGDVTRQVVSLVLLRHAGEPTRAAALFAGVRLATEEVMADVLEVHAAGQDDLARFFDLVLVGELVSLHLARHEGVDPGPVPVVDAVHRVADRAR
jgi:glucose/mannose-6-phosphate isomerase